MHTFALLGVSQSTYDEIAAKLREAGYDHAFTDKNEIDMHGIGLSRLDKAAAIGKTEHFGRRFFESDAAFNKAMQAMQAMQMKQGATIIGIDLATSTDPCPQCESDKASKQQEDVAEWTMRRLTLTIEVRKAENLLFTPIIRGALLRYIGALDHGDLGQDADESLSYIYNPCGLVTIRAVASVPGVKTEASGPDVPVKDPLANAVQQVCAPERERFTDNTCCPKASLEQQARTVSVLDKAWKPIAATDRKAVRP